MEKLQLSIFRSVLLFTLYEATRFLQASAEVSRYLEISFVGAERGVHILPECLMSGWRR